MVNSSRKFATAKNIVLKFTCLLNNHCIVGGARVRTMALLMAYLPVLIWASVYSCIKWVGREVNSTIPKSPHSPVNGPLSPDLPWFSLPAFGINLLGLFINLFLTDLLPSPECEPLELGGLFDLFIPALLDLAPCLTPSGCSILCISASEQEWALVLILPISGLCDWGKSLFWDWMNTPRTQLRSTKSGTKLLKCKRGDKANCLGLLLCPPSGEVQSHCTVVFHSPSWQHLGWLRQARVGQWFPNAD